MSETPEEKVPLPTADEEFVFETIESAPAWVDKGWAGMSPAGPTLNLPMHIHVAQPYTTITAEVGDTVKFIAAAGTAPERFEVVKAAPPEAEAAAEAPAADETSTA